MMARRPNTVQKEANLIKQKYIKTETAALNIKNQLKSSTENKKIEDIPIRTLKDHQLKKIDGKLKKECNNGLI
jgi:hypothetical protein